MNISLTPQLEEIVQDKVKSGMYTSASEVLREALRLLVQKENKDAEIERLRMLIHTGIESGKPKPLKQVDELVEMAKKKHSR
jgi:antitoxin ParD1/3/4